MPNLRVKERRLRCCTKHTLSDQTLQRIAADDLEYSGAQEND